MTIVAFHDQDQAAKHVQPDIDLCCPLLTET